MGDSRRTFLKGISLGASGVFLSPILERLAAEAAGIAPNKLPQRFVFVMKSSGIIPERLQPPSLEKTLADKTKFIDQSLSQHKLSATLEPLEPYRDQTTILQGLSGKMCRPGHSSWFGAMGVYKTGGEHNSGVILRATVDAELAKLNPSPFGHVGLALRGKVMGKETEGTLYPGITASGPGRELPFQASPDTAYEQLFGGAIAGNHTAVKRHQLKSNLLDSISDDIRKLNHSLPGTEREKMGHYLNAFEELKTRRKKLQTMTDQIKQHAPEFSDRFSSLRPTDNKRTLI